MSHTKRIGGAYTISASGGMTIDNALIVTGDLTVSGTTTTIDTTNAVITDRIVTYNDGETGAGVTGQYSGIEVDRGSTANALLVFNETTDTFQVSTDGGSSYLNILTGSGGSGISDVVDDLTPQLGGGLDLNSQDITGTGNIDITGSITTDSNLVLTDASAPSSISGATILYAGTASGGGTGLFFVDGSTSDELVSKSKAIVYGLIF
jgi:hypothetical protein